jgi:hypothetical protein
VPEAVSGRSARTWRRACTVGTAWLADVDRASRWAVADDDPLDAIGLSQSPFGSALAQASAFACSPAAVVPAEEKKPRAPAPRPTAPPRQEARRKTVVRPAPRAARRAPRDRASTSPDAEECAAHVDPHVRAGLESAAPITEPLKRPRLPSAAVCTVPRARLAALAGEVSHVRSVDESMPVKRPRARAEVASAVADAAAVRRRGTVPIIPADADAACGALAERVVERAARVVAPGFVPRRRERAKIPLPPRDTEPRDNVVPGPPANVSLEPRANVLRDPQDTVPSEPLSRPNAASRSGDVAHERGHSGAAETLAAAWKSRIEPGDVRFERVAPAVNGPTEAAPRLSPPTAAAPAPVSPLTAEASTAAASPRKRAFEFPGPPAPAPEPEAPAAAYPPRDLIAPTARRNVVAETDSVRIDPPVVDAPSAPLTPLRARRGFPFPAAAPLSVAESVAEERPAFDSVVFAEQVRAALVHDARRHGIDV